MSLKEYFEELAEFKRFNIALLKKLDDLARQTKCRENDYSNASVEETRPRVHNVLQPPMVLKRLIEEANKSCQWKPQGRKHAQMCLLEKHDNRHLKTKEWIRKKMKTK